MGLNPDPGDLADDTRRPEGQQQQTPLDQVPPEFRIELQRTRGEAAKYRVQNRDLKAQLAGLDPDGSGRVSLSAVQQENRQLKVEKSVLEAAHNMGIGDLRRLRFELSESDALKQLDPSDAHFSDDLSTLLEELAVNVPELMKGGRPGSGPAPTTGARFTPAPPSGQLTRAQLDRMTPEQVDAAYRRGDADSLLGRR